MGVKINILKNASAGIFSKFSGSLIRLLQVPLLLHFLGVEDFGRWTVLYTIPAWLSFTNLGFGSVGANQISMNVAKGDFINARRIFSTTIAIIGTITVIGVIITVLIVPLIKWETLLKATELRHQEFYLSVIWLSLTVFISFLYEAFWGIFRAAHKAHLGVLISSLLPWLNLLAIFIALKYSVRFDNIAMALFISNVFFLFLYFFLSFKVMQELSFSFKTIQPSQIRYLFRKGIAFQAFPLGNALVIQGYVIIVQAILGPAAVALFSTAKTLVNTVKQGLDIICQATWPELSHLIGSNNLQKAKTIHYTGVALAIVISIFGVVFLTLFGGTIYHIWIGKSILLPFPLLILFLLPLPFNALWVTSSVVHLSSNGHEGLALRYLFAAMVSSIICYVLTSAIGIAGAAISILIMDILLIPYVIRHSLILTGDTLVNFYDGTIKLIKDSPQLLFKTTLDLVRGNSNE